MSLPLHQISTNAFQILKPSRPLKLCTDGHMDFSETKPGGPQEPSKYSEPSCLFKKFEMWADTEVKAVTHPSATICLLQISVQSWLIIQHRNVSIVVAKAICWCIIMLSTASSHFSHVVSCELCLTVRRFSESWTVLMSLSSLLACYTTSLHSNYAFLNASGERASICKVAARFFLPAVRQVSQSLKVGVITRGKGTDNCAVLGRITTGLSITVRARLQLWGEESPQTEVTFTKFHCGFTHITLNLHL